MATKQHSPVAGNSGGRRERSGDGLAHTPEIPEKLHFKIGEVSHLTDLKPHVLRYWETEFSALRPQKTRTNQRLYRRQDVELLLLIKRLLYQEGFTIAGAQRRLRELKRNTTPATDEDNRRLLRRLRGQVRDILALVEEDVEDANDVEA